MTAANLEDLLSDLDVLTDIELQRLLERWAYLLPEEKFALLSYLNDLLAGRGAQSCGAQQVSLKGIAHE
jgi:hypothetical protein